MYKTKDEEGKEKRRREEAGGAGEVLIGRGSGNGGANRQTVQIGLPGNGGAYRQTVQMGLPGKVRDLCQICNWARTVTLLIFISNSEQQLSYNLSIFLILLLILSPHFSISSFPRSLFLFLL